MSETQKYKTMSLYLPEDVALALRKLAGKLQISKSIVAAVLIGTYLKFPRSRLLGSRDLEFIEQRCVDFPRSFGRFIVELFKHYEGIDDKNWIEFWDASGKPREFITYLAKRCQNETFRKTFNDYVQEEKERYGE